MYRLLLGDVRQQLATLEAGSVHLACTSPPFWQLRQYLPTGHPDRAQEIGSEATPEAFVETLVDVFRGVKRVLRPDGLAFINLAGSYAGSGKGPTGHNGIGDQEARQGFSSPSRKNTLRGGKGLAPTDKYATALLGSGRASPGYPAKCFIPTPFLFCQAMIEDGWILRDVIAWCKKAPMPGSQRDRCTTAWEPIFMFSKQGNYYYDIEGCKEESGAVLRNFWLLGPEPLDMPHFAAFPSEIPRRCILLGTSQMGCCQACGAGWVRSGTQPASVLGEAVRVSRERLGLTREQLATAVGKGANNVWDWEVGGHVPSGQHWDAFAAALALPYTRAQFVEQAEYIVTGSQDGPKRRASADDPHINRPYTERKLRVPSQGAWSPFCSCADPRPPAPCVVLDPFAGSSTTLLVAQRLGRDSIGIELSEAYIALSRKRLDSDAPLLDAVAAEPTYTTSPLFDAAAG